MTSRARWVRAGLVALLLALILGRWLAVTAADHLWASSVGSAESHANILRLRLSLFAWAVSASWLWCTGNLFLVYRSIGSVHVPRRLANIEIVEAFPRKYLLYGVVGLGLVLALATSHNAGDWWSARVLAGRGPDVGLPEPMLNRDLAFYLYVLPWRRLLHGFATLLSVTMVGVTTVLYVAVGAIAVRNRRIWVSGLARRHLGGLLAILAIALFVGYRLEPAEFVAGIHPVPIDTVLTDIRFTTSKLLSGFALLAAAVSVLWVRYDRLALVAFGWIWLTAFSIIGHYIVPAVASSSRATEDLRVENLHRDGGRLMGVAFGLDGTDTLISGDPVPTSPGESDAALVWDPFELTVFLNAAVPGDPAYRFFDASITSYRLPDSSRVPVGLAVRELDVQFLRQLEPEIAWERLHTGAYAKAVGVWGLRADLVAPDGSPLFVAGPEQPELTVSDPNPVNVRGDMFFSPASGDFVVLPQEAADGVTGVVLDSWLRRVALAWKLQSPSLLRRSVAPGGSRVLWERAIGSRLRTLVPFVEFGRAYPVVADGRVYWMASGLVSAEGFPLVPSVRWRGRSVRYLRSAFIGVVDAHDGRTSVYLMPGADPLSRTWAALTPDLIRSWDKLSPNLAEHVRYPAELFETQMQILQDADRRAPESWPRSLPDDAGGPVAFWRVSKAPSDSVERLRVGAALERGEPPVLSAVVDGFIAGGQPTLDLYRLRPPLSIPGPSQVASRFASELGSEGHVLGTIRTLITASGVLSLQPVYTAVGPDDQPPRLTSVFAAFAGGTRGVGRGRTATTAIQRASETSIPRVDPTGAWNTARRWLERLDTARRTGDWVEFGRAYRELLQLFGVTQDSERR